MSDAFLYTTPLDPRAKPLIDELTYEYDKRYGSYFSEAGAVASATAAGTAGVPHTGQSSRQKIGLILVTRPIVPESRMTKPYQPPPGRSTTTLTSPRTIGSTIAARRIASAAGLRGCFENRVIARAYVSGTMVTDLLMFGLVESESSNRHRRPRA